MKLQWRNPPFDGPSPTVYRIHMKNLTRNYNHWSAIPYTGIITALHFTVPNLPAGIRCAFRVEAFSRGGWSEPSEACDYVCPGELHRPLDFLTRWSRLAAGGPLAIVDRLNAYPFIRVDALKGLQLLLVFGQKDDGFHKGKLQVLVAAVVIKLISIYKDDPDILPYSFKVIGFALRGAHYRLVEEAFIEERLPNECLRYYELFRTNTAVISSLVFLQSCLSIDICVIPMSETDFDLMKAEE